MTTRILLVDDQPLFLQGVASLLDAQLDLEIVGTAGCVGDAVRAAHTLKPDLILMDFNLPDGSGLDATLSILADRPETTIVFLTVFDEDEKLFSALRLGAKGYVLKDVSGSELLAFTHAVIRGEPALTPALNARVLQEFARPRPGQGAPSGDTMLTQRELEVLAELSKGASNDEIANRLVISLSTAKNHVHNILGKLHVRSRREAAGFASARAALPQERHWG